MSLISVGSTQPLIDMVKSSGISTGKLKRFLALHLRPIDLVVYQGPSVASRRTKHGILISGWASRLDAFSGYPFPT
jgi:hypothetical protein